MQQAAKTDHDSLLTLIRDVSNVDSRLLGIDYLQALMCRATEKLGFDFGLIGVPDPDIPGDIKTRVLCAGSELQENFNYVLQGTPCENVYDGQRVSVYTERVQSSFPEDDILVEMGIEGYIGAPLLAPDLAPLGILAFMHQSPFETNPRLEAFMEYFASRVGMELMREQTLEIERQAEERQSRQSRLTALGQVVSGVAHDFNNLLAGLQGHADLLERKLGDDPELSRHLEGINQTIQRAKSTTRTLLDFSSAKARRAGVAELADVFAELADHAAQNFPRDISFRMEAPASGLCVQIDEGHLHQILLNLVLNARDALSSGGEVSLRVLDSEQPLLATYAGLDAPNSVAIQVSDTGSGIDPAIMDKIFDPFFSTKPRDKGTGLGLTGVHQLIDAYGGGIFVESEPNAGTEFTIVLPLADAKASAAAVDTDNVTAPSDTDQKILLAEDDEGISELTSELLDFEGYSVITALDGNTALSKFLQAEADENPFDMLITDINMPGRNGLELLSDLRRYRPELKAIVCTGDTLSPEARSLTASGWCTVLEKPYPAEKLLEEIARQFSE